MPAPVAARGQVLVDVKAAGVNFPDVLMTQASTSSSRRCRSPRDASSPAW
jgi:NADPH:quinone reductase-like Zn-dependent oxidoreductase